MFARERHNAIKTLVRKHRRLDFADLQTHIQVSPATLRRDLAELEKNGVIIRVHGGVLDPVYARAEISFDERLLRNHAAKKTIAEKAVELIPSGASVFVDAGSTCLEAGKLLLSRKDVCLITHSVALLAASLHGEAEILCIGGSLRKVSGAFIGGAALRTMDQIHADFAFLGATGMDLQGLSTTELSEAAMKQAILQQSTRSILLADSTKWQNNSTVRFSQWDAIDDWVTEKTPSPEEVEKLHAARVAIHASK